MPGTFTLPTGDSEPTREATSSDWNSSSGGGRNEGDSSSSSSRWATDSTGKASSKALPESVREMFLCSSCGALQPVDRGVSYFELFGL